MKLQRHAFVAAFALAALSGRAEAIPVKTAVKSVEPGSYATADVQGQYSGLYGANGTRLGWDDVAAFTYPEHVDADFLWFTTGSMSWPFPVAIPAWSHVRSVSFTAELASECPGYNWTWNSDIVLALDGVAVGTWTAPGDPGGTPAVLPNTLGGGSAFGWLVTWTVDEAGTWVEAQFRDPALALSRIRVSDVTVRDLPLVPGAPLAVALDVPGRPDGFGLNLFGHAWGDYPVDPTVTVQYVDAVRIDVKPGSDPNVVNLGSNNGNLPVAIFGSATFDATAVLPGSVTLADVPAIAKQYEVQDVDLDGVLDLVVHFPTQLFKVGSGEVRLAGQLAGGAPFEGFDSLTVR